MNKEKIHQLAREAGIQGLLTDVVCQLSELETFAELIVKDAREECAQICYYVSIDLVGEDSAERCAKEIRLLNEDMQ